MRLGDCLECGINFGPAAAADNTELQAPRARQLLLFRGQALWGEGHRRIGRIHKYAEGSRLGRQFRQQLKTFLVELGTKDRESCEIAARVSQAVDQPPRNRVDPNDEYDRDRSAGFAGRARSRNPARRENHIHFPRDEFGGQARQPVKMCFRPAIFDREVVAVDIAGFEKTLAKRFEIEVRVSRTTTEEADHRRLLLSRNLSRGHRCAAEKGKKLTPPHLIRPAWSCSRSNCRKH